MRRTTTSNAYQPPEEKIICRGRLLISEIVTEKSLQEMRIKEQACGLSLQQRSCCFMGDFSGDFMCYQLNQLLPVRDIG